jgi:hypothetical protein
MPIDMRSLALKGAQARVAELFAEIESLVKMFPALKTASAQAAGGAGSAPRKRRKMSEATKAKLRAAWARRKASASRDAAPHLPQASTERTKVPHKKRTLSAEARAKISAAQKRRWTEKKKSGTRR